MSAPLLDIRRLAVRFGATEAVREVSFTIGAGERFALVGESGSGKTVTALSVLRLLGEAQTTGEILWQGENLLDAGERRLRAVRGGDKAEVTALVVKHLNRYKIDEQAIREKYAAYFTPRVC